MDDQLRFADVERDAKRKETRWKLFLDKMDKVIPWTELESVIDPFYPKAGTGRRPYPLRTMLRIHLM